MDAQANFEWRIHYRREEEFQSSSAVTKTAFLNAKIFQLIVSYKTVVLMYHAILLLLVVIVMNYKWTMLYLIFESLQISYPHFQFMPKSQTIMDHQMNCLDSKNGGRETVNHR